MSPAATDTVTCDACPIRCVIKPGRTGSCDRYGNVEGTLTRLDPLLILERTRGHGGALVPFAAREGDWEGGIVPTDDLFVTGAGSGTTYPDYKPAPFIVSSTIEGVDMITVVTEGIFSYCGALLKIDTDRHVGAERQLVRAQGEPIGHVTTGQYGSQMLSLGGVNHLTGGTKSEGLATMRALLAICAGDAIEVQIDEGAALVLQAGRPPTINGVVEERMRVGCGSATIGMFARQWFGLVDEVVVVDDH
ncbi:MAG: 6-hydroxynicotinate reductase, partial [Actinomycetota bacterium]